MGTKVQNVREKAKYFVAFSPHILTIKIQAELRKLNLFIRYESKACHQRFLRQLIDVLSKP
jgi:hypothetical protein